MKKLTTALIAGAAGVSLLTAGASFALWGDSSSVDAGSLDTGDIGITSSAGAWTDVSKGAPGTSIDLASFKSVPGDSLQLRQTATIVSTGDNMSASLTASGGSDASALSAQGVIVTYSLFEADGVTPVAGAQDVALGTPSTVVIPKTAKAGDEYVIAVDAEFASSTSAKVTTDATLQLGSLTFALNQTRS